jgi:hypothetical protein
MVSIDVADAIIDTYNMIDQFRDSAAYGDAREQTEDYELVDSWGCELNRMSTEDYDEGSMDHAVLNTLALLSERVLLGGE